MKSNFLIASVSVLLVLTSNSVFAAEGFDGHMKLDSRLRHQT